ncbi:MAG: hypothetical protein B7Z55_14390, partial [Planctomycetales bacterium 12-60-4]
IETMKTLILTAVLAAAVSPVLAYDGWGHNSNCNSGTSSQYSNPSGYSTGHLGSAYQSAYRGQQAYGSVYGNRSSNSYGLNSSYNSRYGYGTTSRGAYSSGLGSSWNSSVRDPWDYPTTTRLPYSRLQNENQYSTPYRSQNTLLNRWSGSTYSHSPLYNDYVRPFPDSRY